MPDRVNAKCPARTFSETEQILAKRIWEGMLNSPHGNLVKKIALLGTVLLLFSLGCSGKADAPLGDVNPGNSSTTDDHGNTQDRATLVTSGTQVVGNIETGDDQDYFSIEVAGGVRLRAAATGDVNTIGHIYDSNGNELAANDDDGEGMNFNVSVRIAAAGTYYVRVTSSGTGTGMYELTVTSIPDDHGNTRASATPIMIGMPIDGEIDPGTDEDYFSIQVSSTDLNGIDFLILTATTTGMTDTMGTLYDSSGNELASDDNSGTGMNFELSSQIASAGTYYVRVAGSDTGMYSLTVTSIAGDHGNTRASATPVTSGAAITGNINPGTDPDYFSIEVTSVELSGRGPLLLKAATNGSLDTVGHLYDSFGRELAMDDDTFSGGNFWFSHRITTAGTYYVRVTSKGMSTGMYGLTITLDDHGDLRAQATPVTVGTPIAGNIETPDDQDYFSIVVTSTDLASADALELRAITTGSTDTTGYLYDSDGNQLAFDFDNGTDTNFEISYAITTAGTYYIEVINNYRNTGVYHVTVTTTAGDHGNDRGSATPVRSGTAVTGNIGTGTDEDWFSIRVTHTYLVGIDFLVLRATTTGMTNTMGALYNSSGRELAADDDGGTGMNFDVSARITSTGTYYVKVSSSGSATGMYGLTVTTTTGDHSDMRDTSATSITSGTAINGHIDPNTDEDHFAIVVSSTQLTSIDFVLLRASTTGTTDTIGTIYDSSGMELATDDDGGSTGTNFDVSARITTAGTYYIKVASESMDTGMYSLTATTTAGDHGNTRDSATPIMSPAAITGNISPGADEDYFSIEVTNTDLASADTFVLSASITGGTNTWGALYDSGGTQLAFDGAFSSYLNFEISYNITSAGTYYVLVRTRLILSEMYSLTITAAGRDHGDDRDSATPAALAMAITGNIDPGTDEDYFSIEVDSGALDDVDVIVFRATTTGTTNTIGTIYDSDGRELATDDDGGSTGTNFDASARIINGGTYYVKVASVGSGMGDYSLTVTTTGRDHGNDIPSATPLKNGERATGLIGETDSPDDPGTDVDYFSIEVTRGGTLTAITAQFTLTSGTLYNSSGMPLVTDQRDSTTHNVNISYTIMPADTGTYYLKVSAATAVLYDLIVALDSHSDVLNHMAVSGDDDFATPVTSGTAVAGDIAPLDDIDYFQITVAGAGTLRATTTSSIRTLGYLYDSSGNELANDTARSGTGGNFDLSHSITTAGTYYIKVDGELGAYSLTVTFSP